MDGLAGTVPPAPTFDKEKSVKVWILVLYMSSVYQGGPTVIDNISTLAECERVRAVVTKLGHTVDSATTCIEVTKAAQK